MEFIIFFLVITMAILIINMHFIIKKGWGAVAKVFPGDENPTGEIIKFAYMWVGKGVYKNSVKVTISPEGLYLNLYFLAAIFQKPVLIPWNQIYLKKNANFLGIPRYYFNIGDPAITELIIYDKLYKSLKPHLVNII